MKKVNRPPIVFGVGLLLLCLTLLSVNMTSGLYARYVTQAEGSDSARVAKFDLTAPADYVRDVEVVLSPGTPCEYEFVFTNSGETTLRYVITMTNTTGNLPLVLTGETGVIEMGQTVTAKCKIGWDPADLSAKHSGKVDVVRMDIVVEQVD